MACMVLWTAARVFSAVRPSGRWTSIVLRVVRSTSVLVAESLSLRSICWAERWIRRARYDRTDNVPLFGQAHARKVLAAYEDHFNGHRPHQTRDRTPPDADIAEVSPIEGRIRRGQVPPPPSTSTTEPPDPNGELAGQGTRRQLWHGIGSERALRRGP